MQLMCDNAQTVLLSREIMMANDHSPIGDGAPHNPFQFTDLGESEQANRLAFEKARYRSKVLDLLLWLFPNFVVAMASCVWVLMMVRHLGPVWAGTVIALLFVSLYSISQQKVRLLFAIRCLFLSAGSVWVIGILKIPGMNVTDAKVFLIMALIMCAVNMIHLAVFGFRFFQQSR